MKLASYNVENLFERAKALNLDDWKAGKAILDDYAKFNAIIAKESYTKTDKEALLALLEQYGLTKETESEYFLLRENRGRLRKKATSKTKASIVANGRSDWLGWLELMREPVNSAAMSNTARVIADINADVIGIIEAEDRPGLKHFNEHLLPEQAQYRHIMLIDGNDERGIDVGIMSKKMFPITAIRSHVDDRDNTDKAIFSRDCAGYEIRTPKGNTLWLLVNHLKSKGYGNPAASNKKRLAQARRVREIYDQLVQTSPYVAIIGDMNDTPTSAPLAPLCGNGSPLNDVTSGVNFNHGGRPGTYGSCTASNKIDYILCSPALFAKMKGGGIHRLGMWGGTNGTLFPHYDSITKKEEAASDHALLWAEFDI